MTYCQSQAGLCESGRPRSSRIEVPQGEADGHLLIEHHRVDHPVVRARQVAVAVRQTVVERQEEALAGIFDDVEGLGPFFVRE